MNKTALLLSTAMGVADLDKETTAVRQLQFQTGLDSVLDLTEQLNFTSVFISDNTVSDVRSLSPSILESLARIERISQFIFFDNWLGAKNKGAGVLTQLRTVLPALTGNFERLVFFEPRQKIQDPAMFQRILEADRDVFKVTTRLVLRRNLVPWIYREVHTGFFSVRYEALQGFVNRHQPEALASQSISLERALYLHLRKHKIRFEKAGRLGLVRVTADREYPI